jgi:hypothetical protein
MFTDIVASTNIAAAIGDEAWEHLLAGTMTPLRAVFVDHEGEVVLQSGAREVPSVPDPWMCWRWNITRPCERMTTLRPPSSVAVRVTVPLAPLPFDPPACFYGRVGRGARRYASQVLRRPLVSNIQMGVANRLGLREDWGFN